VVFGASGAIGGAVVSELVCASRRVRAVSRGGRAPAGAQGAAADASDPDQAARATAGASVIYHCASPPYTRWPELFPALTSSILGAAESSGAKLVFADNLYAYGPVEWSTPASSKPPSATWSPPRTATRYSEPSPGTGPTDRRATTANNANPATAAAATHWRRCAQIPQMLRSSSSGMAKAWSLRLLGGDQFSWCVKPA
jgi:NAD(P)H-binding